MAVVEVANGRRRTSPGQFQPTSSTGRDAVGDSKNGTKGHVEDLQTGTNVEPPQQSSKAPGRLFTTAGALKIIVASAALAYVAWRIGTRTPTILADAYILCSPRGQAIYTVDDNNVKVSCLAVNGSHIFDAGELVSIQNHWLTVASSSSPLNVKFIPEGSIIVPGMSDSHGHTLEYGASRQLSLEGAKDVSEAVERVRDFIQLHPEILEDKKALIEGWGWDHTSWPKEQFPTSVNIEYFLLDKPARMIYLPRLPSHPQVDLDADQAVRGRLVILRSKDGHALWLSSAMLETIEEIPSFVEGGVIVRDDKGVPTGVLLDKAHDLLKVPPLTESDRARRFNIAANDALSKGLTAFHDAGLDPASLTFFLKRADEGKLPVRVYGMTYFNDSAPYWGAEVTKVVDHNRLTARSVKIFADGALRSGGAALYDPYSDNPETNGFMTIDVAVLYQMVPKFLKDGWQVNIHAIGDRANAMILDVFEAASKHVNLASLRPRIEHAQLILERDMKRMAKLGVIASIQPTHAISDMWYAQDRLGPERIKNLYAFRSMLDNGVRVTLGSDFPVEDMNPLAGFYAAVTRLSPDGKSPQGEKGWFPEQCLTREEALRGITIDPAFASFTEDKLGSLVPGKLADFVVLSQDIMTVPSDKILETEVLATVLDGRVAFGSI